MKLRFFTFYFSLFTFMLTAYAQTGSDYMQAFKKADADIPFDVNAEGKEFRVKWGMDTAWDWDYNVNRGVAHIGKGNFETGRVSFQPNDLVTDNGDGTYTLTTRQQSALRQRCKHQLRPRGNPEYGQQRQHGHCQLPRQARGVVQTD